MHSSASMDRVFFFIILCARRFRTRKNNTMNIVSVAKSTRRLHWFKFFFILVRLVKICALPRVPRRIIIIIHVCFYCVLHERKKIVFAPRGRRNIHGGGGHFDCKIMYNIITYILYAQHQYDIL